MTGFRNKKRVNHFVQIDKNMLSDSKISWKAKGILAYLLSKPDGWITYLVDIEKQSTDGRDSVRAGVKELLEAGYLERKRVREGGKFRGWEYSVYEYPNVSESTENGLSEIGKAEYGKSDVGLSEDGKPATSNNNLSNNDLRNNELTNNNYNDNNAREEDENPENQKPKENPFTFFEQNGFGALGKHIGDKIGFWIDDLNEELVLQAMKISIENGANNWNYVEAILRDWLSKGFKSIDDYKAFELKREQERKRKSANRRSYGPAPKEGLVPEWLQEQKQSVEQVPVAKESSDDIEEQRRQLQEELKRTRSNFVKKGSN